MKKYELKKTLIEIYDQSGRTLEDLIPGTTFDEVLEAMDQTGLTFEELVEQYVG